MPTTELIGYDDVNLNQSATCAVRLELEPFDLLCIAYFDATGASFGHEVIECKTE